MHLTYGGGHGLRELGAIIGQRLLAAHHHDASTKLLLAQCLRAGQARGPAAQNHKGACVRRVARAHVRRALVALEGGGRTRHQHLAVVDAHAVLLQRVRARVVLNVYARTCTC